MRSLLVDTWSMLRNSALVCTSTHGRWYANAMLGWGWEGGMITFVVCECSFVGEAGWFCASHARMT